MPLRPVAWLAQVFPGVPRSGCYRLAKAHPQWVVKVGQRRLYLREELVLAFVERGGDRQPAEPVAP